MTYTPSDIPMLILGAFVVAAVGWLVSAIVLEFIFGAGEGGTAWGSMFVFVVLLGMGLCAAVTT